MCIVAEFLFSQADGVLFVTRKDVIRKEKEKKESFTESPFSTLINSNYVSLIS
jgi:hypothetical protein